MLLTLSTGQVIRLITLAELVRLPPTTQLISIFGWTREHRLLRLHDTHFFHDGYLSFGLPIDQQTG